MQKLCLSEKELVERNMKLVYHIMKKFYIPQGEFDNLESAGMRGLVKAAKTYRPAQKIKFASYASKCIFNEILMEFRNEKKRRKEVSLDATVSTDAEGEVLTFSDFLYDKTCEDCDEQLIRREMIAKSVEYALNKLKPICKLAFLYRVYGLKQEEIADTIGISRPYISRILNIIKVKLREYLIKETSDKKQTYTVAFWENKLIIEFVPADITSFKEALARLLLTEVPADYKICFSNGKVTIVLLIDNNAFLFLGRLMEEIDFPKEEETKDEPKVDIIVETKEEKCEVTASQVRDYIYSLISFSTFKVSDLRKRFPGGDKVIEKVVYREKNKGYIFYIGGGQYLIIGI